MNPEAPVRKLVILAAALIAATAHAQLPVEAHRDQLALLTSSDALLAANKRLVFDFWREIRQAHDVERAADFITEGFIEHDPDVPAGRAAFVRFIGRQPKEPAKSTIDDLVTIVAERDLVVLGLRRELADLANEGQTYTTTSFEMFRIEGGKIAEHWSSAIKE
jgi:predicted SnoaL-like aldol condensation-catalyzing enzyme